MSVAASPGILPRHIAIIMDGNGRWAQSRGLPRIAGHRRGAEAVRRTVTAAAEIGIPYLTLFGFSSENWKRPLDEIDDLMGLLRHYLRGEIAELHGQGVRLRVIGETGRLSADIITLIDNAEALTRGSHNRGRGQERGSAARRRRRGADRPASVHRRAARSRSVDPHQRRAAHQQFPALAVRLCRARLHQDAVAGFRARRSRSGDCRLLWSRAAIRCLGWLALNRAC